MKNYPFVLGAQSLRMIDLAAFYAAIVNEGMRVTPYAIDSIEQNGHSVYKHQAGAPVMMAGGDRAAFYQLRTILEGVVARGTAASLRHLTGFVGGKTGTTDNENDAWFVGFTSDVTVAVWVGYDNARGKQTLGRGSTGGHTAVSDRRADHPGHLESACAENAVAGALGGSRAPSQGAADRLHERPKARRQQPQRVHRVFQARRQQEAAGHSIFAGRAQQPGARRAAARHGRRFRARSRAERFRGAAAICSAIRRRAAAAVESSATKLAGVAGFVSRHAHKSA